MNFFRFAALVGLSSLLPMPALRAQSPAPSVTLRYRFVPGQRLAYLVQRDPYFDAPAEAMETTDANSPYRPPVVERLTEDVLAVEADGTATLRVTVAPEPGFEDEAHPQAAVTRTVRVTALGEVVSPLAETIPADLLRAFFRLPDTPVRPGAVWKGNARPGGGLTLTAVDGGVHGLAVVTQAVPPVVTEGRSRGHDGVLVQIMRRTQSDRFLFDLSAGNLRRRRSAMTVAFSLVMTGRGKRGADDFGHVIPTVQVVQTLTVERRDDLGSAPQPSPTKRQANRSSAQGSP